MSMNRLKLKESQVTLLLSSRAEMQKIIERARAASGFANKAALPTPEAITNQFVTKKVVADISSVSQTPNLVSNYLQTPLMTSGYQSPVVNGIPGLGGATNAPTSSIPMYYNPADYIKLVNSSALVSQQFLQQQQLQQQAQNSISRDPRGQSRYQRSSSRERVMNNRNNIRRERSRSPYSSENDEKKERRRRTRFSSPEKKISLAPVIATNNASVTAVVTSMTPQMALIQQQQQLMQQQHNQVIYLIYFN